MFKRKSIVAARVIFTFLTTALIIFIFSNSLKNAEDSSASSGFFTALINSFISSLGFKFQLSHDFVRTFAHFSEFGLLGVMSMLMYLSFFAVKAKTMIISVCTFSLTALIDECFQLFSDGRAFQLSDIAVDISGGLLGAVVVFLVAMLIYSKNIKVQRRKFNGESNEEE